MSAAIREVDLLKLGGSLITDKRSPGTARDEVIERLAREVASTARSVRTIVGHGSGSFGHVAAARARLGEGYRDPGQLPGITETQLAAASLNRLVLDALARAGGHPFAFSPSSAMVSSGGRPVNVRIEGLLLALELGLLPVVHGDIVLDRRQGVAICSTETVLLAVAGALRRKGIRVRRMIWLGDTDGVYDADGRTIPQVTEDNYAAVGRHVRGASGTDVTGGMVHRLRTAMKLARQGIPSWIVNGLAPGNLEGALAGEDVPRTEVVASG